ncbi:Hypothetical_protein [Hexamita inflata]|uniref:Hypothetical_protein n=1 Tax=Hexamita inflata TaxID=28002 RepID=A0ABP1GG65_9EUKA
MDDYYALTSTLASATDYQVFDQLYTNYLVNYLDNINSNKELEVFKPIHDLDDQKFYVVDSTHTSQKEFKKCAKQLSQSISSKQQPDISSYLLLAQLKHQLQYLFNIQQLHQTIRTSIEYQNNQTTSNLPLIQQIEYEYNQKLLETLDNLLTDQNCDCLQQYYEEIYRKYSINAQSTIRQYKQHFLQINQPISQPDELQTVFSQILTDQRKYFWNPLYFTLECYVAIGFCEVQKQCISNNQVLTQIQQVQSQISTSLVPQQQQNNSKIIYSQQLRQNDEIITNNLLNALESMTVSDLLWDSIQQQNYINKIVSFEQNIFNKQTFTNTKTDFMFSINDQVFSPQSFIDSLLQEAKLTPAQIFLQLNNNLLLQQASLIGSQFKLDFDMFNIQYEQAQYNSFIEYQTNDSKFTQNILKYLDLIENTDQLPSLDIQIPKRPTIKKQDFLRKIYYQSYKQNTHIYREIFDKYLIEQNKFLNSHNNSDVYQLEYSQQHLLLNAGAMEAQMIKGQSSNEFEALFFEDQYMEASQPFCIFPAFHQLIKCEDNQYSDINNSFYLCSFGHLQQSLQQDAQCKICGYYDGYDEGFAMSIIQYKYKQVNFDYSVKNMKNTLNTQNQLRTITQMQLNDLSYKIQFSMPLIRKNK